MLNKFSDKKEDQLIKRATPYLKKGRPGDYEHTLRAVQYGKQLLKEEEGDPNIVISTLYLHDVGWSQVNFDDFVNARTPYKKYETASVGLHMKKGAVLAKKILVDLDYDEEVIQRITAIIAVHDIQQEIIALNDPSAVIVFEADYLDKIGPESSKRIRKMFKEASYKMDMEVTKTFIENGIKQWFQTKTAKTMAQDYLKHASLSGMFPK